MKSNSGGWIVTAAILAAASAVPVAAQEKLSAEGLAKLAQNPIANLISVPFQNNTNFNYGPRDGTQNIPQVTRPARREA